LGKYLLNRLAIFILSSFMLGAILNGMQEENKKKEVKIESRVFI